MWLVRLYLRVVLQVRPQVRLAAMLAAANIALAIASFAEPVLFGRILDGLIRLINPALPSIGPFGLFPLLILWVVLGLLTILAGVFIAANAERLAHRRRIGVMAGFFENVLQLSLSFHNESHANQILGLMLDGTSTMFSLWLGFFRDQLFALVALCLLPFTVLLNPLLGLLLNGLVAGFAVLTYYVVRRSKRTHGRVEWHTAGTSPLASEAASPVPVVQSFTRLDAEATAMRNMTSELFHGRRPVFSWWAIASIASRASATLSVMVIFLFGFLLHMRGFATVGQIVAFTSLATLLMGRLDQLVAFVNRLVLQAPVITDFFAVFDTAPTVPDRPDARDVVRFEGEVEFEDVSFSYGDARPAVSNISFRAAPGQTVALVGGAGSGRSTALGLLHRAFGPQSGAIRIDGRDIRELTHASLRRNVGVVFQEPMLFPRSIRENLLVGRVTATDAEMLEALERVQMADFLERQAEGLDTVLSDSGRSLSVAERHGLAIARALLQNPPILIVEQAAHALDDASERQLQLALEEVRRGRTTFVIAHRLATIRAADTILVFRNGSIVEAGTFDDLVAQRGLLAELARAQFMDSPQPTRLAAE